MARRDGTLGFALTLALGCAAEVPRDAAPGVTEAWVIDHEQADGALMSVWGGGGRVWAVGGQTDRGLVLEHTGAGWTEHTVDAPGLLWWVYGFGRDDVYAVGERGIVLHHDGSAWRRVPVAWDADVATITLYGLWGASGDDVWVVGTDTRTQRGVILRGNAEGLEPVPDVPEGLVPRALFKAYGFDPDHFIAVGADGAIVRWQAGVWSRDITPTTKQLTSLWGRSQNDLYAVGGLDEGVVLHYDGSTWQALDAVEPGPGLFGVFTAPGEPVYAVGGAARVVELAGNVGEALETEVPTESPDTVLHSVWGDGTGEVWAVGGSLLSYPHTMRGAIFRLEP